MSQISATKCDPGPKLVKEIVGISERYIPPETGIFLNNRPAASGQVPISTACSSELAGLCTPKNIWKFLGYPGLEAATFVRSYELFDRNKPRKRPEIWEFYMPFSNSRNKSAPLLVIYLRTSVSASRTQV